jgi:hypothetical protein
MEKLSNIWLCLNCEDAQLMFGVLATLRALSHHLKDGAIKDVENLFAAFLALVLLTVLVAITKVSPPAPMLDVAHSATAPERYLGFSRSRLPRG